MSLLKVENVHASYGDVKAISDVSLEVGAGEIVALVGANGAGKSTLMRTIVGAHRQTDGSIWFNGSEVSDTPVYERVSLGISLVPEGRRLFTSLTVKENLTVGAATKRSGDWSLESVLEAFPLLKPLLNRNASQLSGGQQQAVAIGRAMMSNPELILLDEVSLGLAPVIVDELYEALGKILQSGLGVIVVEQDLGRAFKVSHKMVCMLEGHVILEGASQSLSRQEVTDAYFGHNVPSLEAEES